MHAPLPEQIEVERAVTTGRIYAGSVKLDAFPRLLSLLADADGEVHFELAFARNVMGQKMLKMQVNTALPLICQATLDRFELPVELDTKLGFVKEEADASGLPEDYEPALMDGGMVNPLALIEDELILAIPVIPRKPDAQVLILAAAPETGAAVADRPNPFTALAALKRH